MRYASRETLAAHSNYLVVRRPSAILPVAAIASRVVTNVSAPTRGDEVGPNVVAVVDLVTGDELVDIDGPGQLDSDGLKVLVTDFNVLALRDLVPPLSSLSTSFPVSASTFLTPEEAQTNLSHYRQAGRAVRLGRVGGRDRSSQGANSQGRRRSAPSVADPPVQPH